MVEITDRRCYVLWVKDKQGRVWFDPTIFNSAHAAIREGERLQDKGTIADYNYSIVHCPQIGAEFVKKPLTSEPRAPMLQL